MNRMRTSAVLAAGVVASAVLVGGPVAAQDEEPAPVLTADPTSGPVGTTISVAGTGCFGVEVWFLLGDNATGYFVVDDYVVPADDGTWSGKLTVPAGYPSDDGAQVPIVPTGDYVVAASCATDEEDQFWYDEVPFAVTGTTEPTTPPTTEPTPPTTAPPVTTASPATTPATPAPATTPPPAAQPITQAPDTLG